MNETSTPEEPVRSPCVSICKLDNTGICIGCFRSGAEISYWTTYSNKEKLAVIDLCNERALAYQA